MRVTLVSPYPDLHAFGLRTLSSCLRRCGHDVQIIFLPGVLNRNYKEVVLQEMIQLCRFSGLVGISLMSNFFGNAIQLTQKLKTELGVPVIWGGIHPTLRPEESLKYADVVCLGEGEESLPELVGKMESGSYYYDVAGMWFKDEEGKVIKNKLRPLICNLDQLPFPDYDYTVHYLLAGSRVLPMTQGRLSCFSKGVYLTIATRGCPNDCTYCSNNALGHLFPGQFRVRRRSIGHIIGELRDAKERLPFIQRIKFDDDAFFTYPLDEIEEFNQRYTEEIALPLVVSGAAPSTLTREKLTLLVGAGLVSIRMGIQTVSENTRKLYHRRDSNRQILAAAKLINEFKTKLEAPQYDIILDNPWETEEELIKTLLFLAKLPVPFRLSLYSLALFPGTELNEKARCEGLITDEFRQVYQKHYHLCRGTYVNSLFLLLSFHCGWGWGLPPRVVSWLVDDRWRRIGLVWPVYLLLWLIAVPFILAAIKSRLLRILRSCPLPHWPVRR